MKNRLIKRSLAVTAVTAIGFSGTFFASPAQADEPETLNLQSDKQIQQALADVTGVNAYGESGGVLHLGAEEKTDELAALDEAYDNVVIEYGIKELERYAANDLVGGAGYHVSIPGGSAACSTGIPGWNGQGEPIVLTAGHCSKVIDGTSGRIRGMSSPLETERPSTSPAVHGERAQASGLGSIGKWGFSSYGSGTLLRGPSIAWPSPKPSDIDFAVLEVDDSNYNVKNGMTDWTTAGSDDLSAGLATDIKKIGAHKETTVKKSGRTTGLTEGEVVPRTDYPYDFSNVGGYWVHGFGVISDVSKPFSQPGDSGGGVFQGDTAVGVISGGGPISRTTEFGWVADLDYSIEKSGVDFTLHEPDDGPGDDNAKADADGDNAKADADGDNAKADADGDNAKADADGDNAKADADSDGSKDGDAPVEQSITIDPKEIAAADFVKQDKGVKITAKGFDEGEKVTLKVVSGPDGVKDFTLDETANKDGVAAFSVYGKDASDPSVYLGKYDLKVAGANDSAGEKALTGSFTVIKGDGGNGGGSSEGGSNGSSDGGNGSDSSNRGSDGGGDGGGDLPRTGAELTGLAAGAALVVAGGAAVTMTLRRRKGSNPSSEL